MVDVHPHTGRFRRWWRQRGKKVAAGTGLGVASLAVVWMDISALSAPMTPRDTRMNHSMFSCFGNGGSQKKSLVPRRSSKNTHSISTLTVTTSHSSNLGWNRSLAAFDRTEQSAHTACHSVNQPQLSRVQSDLVTTSIRPKTVKQKMNHGYWKKDSCIVFKEMKQLAPGWTSNVYRAKINKKTVAVKFLKEMAQKCFVENEKLAIGLDHKNICAPFACLDDSIIVAPYCEGGDLFDFLKPKECEGDPHVLHHMCVDIGIQVMEAVEYLHKEGLLHLDIKPNNIYVVEPLNNERTHIKVMLSDFSFLRKDEDGKGVDAHCGSYFYKAPEIPPNIPVTQAADIWSSACLLYNLFTGQVLTMEMRRAIKAGRHLTLENKYNYPDAAWEKITKLLNSMWKQVPEDRLLVSDVLKELRDIHTILPTD